MNDKARLSKDDFDLLEAERSEEQLYWKERLLLKVTTHETQTDCDFETLLKALVNGYEIDMTPEEEVADYVRHLRDVRDENLHRRGPEYSGRIDSVIAALNILGIRISGVNVE